MTPRRSYLTYAELKENKRSAAKASFIVESQFKFPKKLINNSIKDMYHQVLRNFTHNQRSNCSSLMTHLAGSSSATLLGKRRIRMHCIDLAHVFILHGKTNVEIFLTEGLQLTYRLCAWIKNSPVCSTSDFVD